MAKVVLKAGRERSLKSGHPWIFSGAIETIPSCEMGEILPVYSSEGDFLAQAYFNPGNSLSGRILSFTQKSIEEELIHNLKAAITLRQRLFNPALTNCYRLINAEGDKIPGFTVDVYDKTLVIQVQTQGIERLKPFLVQQLIHLLKPEGIYEKSSSFARREDGLEDFEGVIYGTVPERIQILENGIPYIVAVRDAQKTGFFLDQREMRQKVLTLSKGLRVLNCFSYSGAFGISALKGGAKEAISLDSSPTACALAEENSALNQFSNHRILCTDAFDYLEKEPLDFDLVILDPPAFVKKRKSLDAALKAYQKLNALVIKKMPPRSLLLTSSCSSYVTEPLFQQTLFFAAQASGRFVRVISHHLQASDHPTSIYHPEGSYLKSLLLYIE